MHHQQGKMECVGTRVVTSVENLVCTFQIWSNWSKQTMFEYKVRTFISFSFLMFRDLAVQVESKEYELRASSTAHRKIDQQ
jgi:hypothetical protein